MDRSYADLLKEIDLLKTESDRKDRTWGYRKWRRIREYGDRLAVEEENSCVKRTFGENPASRLETSLCAEQSRSSSPMTS